MHEGRHVARFVVLSLLLHLVALSLFAQKYRPTPERGGIRILNASIASHESTATVSLATWELLQRPEKAAWSRLPLPTAPVISDKARKQPLAPVASPRQANELAVATSRALEVGASPDALRQYRLNLAKEARRYTRLMFSERSGQEGVVMVIVAVEKGMPSPVVALGNSSANEGLDAEALAIMNQAVRSAAIPDTLGGKQFVLHLPMHFSLKD